MRHYQEITLIPNADIDSNFLWSKLYQQLHLGLVAIQDDNKQVPIGLSFPEYHMGEKTGMIGGKCRLFAQEEITLAQFNVVKWLERLTDYVHCTRIRPVPDNLKGYASYHRFRPITNAEKLARRYAKRHGMDFEAALNAEIRLDQNRQDGDYKMQFRYCELPYAKITLPFIRLTSLSNGNQFCLWIKKSSTKEPVTGMFSTYGLSSVSTVPEF